MNYLKRLKYLKDKLKKANITYQTKPIEDIENALKRLEELEEEKQSFDRVIEKKLKALKIIKEKQIDIQTLKRTNNVIEYNSYVAKGFGEKELSPEEYELLKEVLL